VHTSETVKPSWPGVVATLLAATALSACNVRGSLALVLPDEATALATARIAVSLARPGGHGAARDLCADPAAATFDTTLDLPYPIADGMVPDLKTGWYAVWAEARDAGGAVIASACEAVHVGLFRRLVEVALVATGGGGDGGADASADGGTDAATDGGGGGSDAGPVVLDALAVTVAAAEPPALPVAGATVFVADADGDTVNAVTDAAGLASFGPGAALRAPLDVTVRLLLAPGGVDYQQTVAQITPGAGALVVRVPTPLAPAAAAPGMITGAVVGSGAGTSGAVAFVDAASLAGGSGTVNGPGDAYDALLTDTTGTFSGLLRETGGPVERIAVVGPAAVAPAAPDFDLAANAVPRDVASTVTLGAVAAEYDGALELAVAAAAARGDLVVEAIAAPASPVATTVFDPAAAALPAGTALRVALRAVSATTVAACAGAPALEGLEAAVVSALPAPPDFTLAPPAAAIAATPSEGMPSYPAFAAGAPLVATLAGASGLLATVFDVTFTRSDGTPVRLVVVAPGVAAAIPDPAAVGATLTEDDGAGYCLVLSHVFGAAAGYDAEGGLATAYAAGFAAAPAQVAVATRRLAFTR